MSTVRYRRLDRDHDYSFGRGSGDYLLDIEAIAQAIKTKLLLFTDEWWEDLEDGLPFWTSIAGSSGVKKGIRRKIIQDRILSVPHVNSASCTSVASTEGGKFTYQYVADTIFGELLVEV